MIILSQTTQHTNLYRLYQTLNNGQFHVEAREEFVARHQDTYDQHKSYVETFKRIAAKFDYGITMRPMLSVGIQHANALRICRKIARAHGYEFNLDTHIHAASAASADLEEGEVEDCLFANILKLQSNTFFMDAFSYIHVAVSDI